MCPRFVVFSHTYQFTSNALLDVNYRERLELKSSTDRTLGIGASQNDGPLLVLTAATMMKVTINLDKVLAYDFE